MKLTKKEKEEFNRIMKILKTGESCDVDRSVAKIVCMVQEGFYLDGYCDFPQRVGCRATKYTSDGLDLHKELNMIWFERCLRWFLKRPWLSLFSVVGTVLIPLVIHFLSK